MFTGLVQSVGRVVEHPGPARDGLLRLDIDPAPWSHTPALGDSICVSGCCLTLARLEHPAPSRPARWGFDVVRETLDKTTLGSWRPGARVNLEHALTPTTLLGGHFVQGHVDCVGRVVHIQEGDDWRVRVRVSASPVPAGDGADKAAPATDLFACLAPKGSICIDGVSLTIAALDPRQRAFEVALIPTTLDKTTLRDLRVGDGVNLEMDILAKAVVNALAYFAGAAGLGGAGGTA
jgi:riboflavin synthase